MPRGRWGCVNISNPFPCINLTFFLLTIFILFNIMKYLYWRENKITACNELNYSLRIVKVYNAEGDSRIVVVFYDSYSRLEARRNKPTGFVQRRLSE